MNRVPDKPVGMDCIVVGGCARGSIVPNMHIGAKFVELSRPANVKPLESSTQINPEIEMESQIYEIHPISFKNSTGETKIYAIAVEDGTNLSDAFEEMVTGYVRNLTSEMLAAGLITKQ